MTVYLHTGGRDGAGPAVTFLHGAGMDHTVWRYQTRWLANRGWKVVAPDLPGHGGSEGKPFRSVEEGAEWVAGLLADQPGAGAVVGHSLGGLIAVEVAARHSELVGALVVVGSGTRMPVHPALLAAAEADLPRAARLISGWSLPPTHLGVHPEPGTWESGAVVRLVERSGPGVLAADLQASSTYDATERLGDVRTPTLVVSGRFDRMVAPDSARALAEGIPEAGHVILPGAGHQPMVQQPREFNRVLTEFLGPPG